MHFHRSSYHAMAKTLDDSDALGSRRCQLTCSADPAPPASDSPAPIQRVSGTPACSRARSRVGWGSRHARRRARLPRRTGAGHRALR